jgi:hypothetical protein
MFRDAYGYTAEQLRHCKIDLQTGTLDFPLNLTYL